MSYIERTDQEILSQYVRRLRARPDADKTLSEGARSASELANALEAGEEPLVSEYLEIIRGTADYLEKDPLEFLAEQI